MVTKLRVLTISSNFPWHSAPVYGIFVKERLRQIVQDGHATIQVISPKPLVPPVPSNWRWSIYSYVPKADVLDGIPVQYPRYFTLPKIGGYIHPLLMYFPTILSVRKVCRTFRPHLVDAHFAYPNGVLAAWIARRLRLPLVITGRGQDLTLFTKILCLRLQIRKALERATCLIALSKELHDLMVDLGVSPGKVFTIPNGVDLIKFAPVPKEYARAKLGLSQHDSVAVTVGYRIRRKNFDVFIDAVHKLRQMGFNMKGVIVGGPAAWEADRGPELQRKIAALKLSGAIQLVGERPHDELPLWYSAADVFVLLSSREGSPNVVMEALACGVPVVASPVGGVPELLCGRPFAKVLASASVDEAASAIASFCVSPPNRQDIRAFSERYSWSVVGEQVANVWKRAVELYASQERSTRHSRKEVVSEL